MVINLISGPRNISTALMYAFAQRDDTKVVDEPFYAHYLSKHDVDHPGREDILAAMSSDASEVLDQLLSLEEQYEVVFVKNMAQHHLQLDWEYLNDFRNVLLIRDPKQLIASFAQVIDQPTLQDIGLKEEADLFDHIKAKGKHAPIVMDSNDILKAPEAQLRRLCVELDIPFTDKMLRWERGPRTEDGVWAQYWYRNVHQSQGFSMQPTSVRPLPEKCNRLFEEAIPYFEKLKAHKLHLT